MRLYKHLFFILLAITLCTSRTASAAFIIRPACVSTAIVDSPVLYKGEKLYTEEESSNQAYKQRLFGSKTYNKPYVNREKTAKTALILGILGIYPLYGLTAIPALIMGIMAADRRNRYYKQAVWAIILGAIPIAVLIAILVVALLAL